MRNFIRNTWPVMVLASVMLFVLFAIISDAAQPPPPPTARVTGPDEDGVVAPSDDPHVVWQQWNVGGLILCMPPSVDVPDSTRCIQLPEGTYMQVPTIVHSAEHDTGAI